MASTYFKDLYDEAESGVAQASVPAGEYDVVVGSSRPNAKSNQVFVTLDVQNGPLTGKQSDVSVFFPQDHHSRGAHVYFAKKIAGLIAYPDVKAAFQAADNAPTPEAAYQLIADSFNGKALRVLLKVRQDDTPYNGTNDIEWTAAPKNTLSAAPLATSAVSAASDTVVAAAPGPESDNAQVVEAPF